MTRTALRAVAFVLAAAGLSGCMNEVRVVEYNPKVGGVVAIPANTNRMPDYNRDAAMNKIRELYPEFDSRTDEIVDERAYDPRTGIDSKRPLNGPEPVVAMMKAPWDKPEYRIAFKVKPKMITTAGTIYNGNSGLPESTNNGGNVIQAGGLPRNASGQPATTIGGQPVAPAGGLAPNYNATPPTYGTPTPANDPLLRPYGSR